jgi:hypothetical protein
MIPLLAESEKGKGQTESVTKDDKRCGEDKWLRNLGEVAWNGTLQMVIVQYPKVLCRSSKSRAPWIGGLNTAGLTANPK